MSKTCILTKSKSHATLFPLLDCSHCRIYRIQSKCLVAPRGRPGEALPHVFCGRMAYIRSYVKTQSSDNESSGGTRLLAKSPCSFTTTMFRCFACFLCERTAWPLGLKKLVFTWLELARPYSLRQIKITISDDPVLQSEPPLQIPDNTD